MKKIVSIAVIVTLILSTLTVTACGKSEFGATVCTPETIAISAENAEKDAFFMVGTLEVGEKQQIVISGELTEGRVRVEIFKAAEEQSADKLPEIDGEAILTANITTTDSAKGTMPVGHYLVKATCLEKATGTVYVDVKPAD